MAGDFKRVLNNAAQASEKTIGLVTEVHFFISALARATGPSGNPLGKSIMLHEFNDKGLGYS